MLEPVSVGLQFGFLAVLYLFLMWVARSALRELRGNPVAMDEGTAVHSAATGFGRSGPSEPRLLVERATDLRVGVAYDLSEGATLGRGTQANIRFQDPFASSAHARIERQGGALVLEDLGSTNGTHLNDDLLRGPAPLHDGDRIRIGDTEFTYLE